MAVNQHPSAAGVEKARNQMHQRGLACPAGSDNGQHFASLYVEIDIAQHLTSLATFALRSIGKAELLELHVSGKLRQSLGARLLAHVIFKIHEAENFRRCSQGLLKIVIELRELADRIVEAVDSGNESHESSGRELAVPDLVVTKQQKQRNGNGPECIHQR